MSEVWFSLGNKFDSKESGLLRILQGKKTSENRRMSSLAGKLCGRLDNTNK